MTDIREQCIEAAWQAWLAADSVRDGVEAAVDAVAPIIRADERKERGSTAAAVLALIDGDNLPVIRADERATIATAVEARCDRLAHRERIATPPEWPVCAKCMPYFNIARGEFDGD